MSSVMLGPFERHAAKKIISLSDEEAPYGFAQIYKRVGDDPTNLWHQILGKGTMAVATWLKHDKAKVLKVTEDASDAYAMAQFLKSPSRHVVKVYDVFQMTYYAFGMVVQKVTPLSMRAQKHWNTTRNEISKIVGVPGLGNGEVAAHIAALESYAMRKSLSSDERERMRGFLKQLEVFDKALADRGISGFRDYHAGNLGMNGRDIVLLDLGGVRTPVPVLPKLSIEP